MSGTAFHQTAVLGAIGSRILTMDELAAALPISRKKLSNATGKLVARQMVERLETGVYQLSLNGLSALESGASLKLGHYRNQTLLFTNSLQQRAWKAMRLQSRFTIGDIVQLAARDDDLKPEVTLQQLFRRLVRAGYLVQLPDRVSDACFNVLVIKQWRLIRNTGAKAPCYVPRTKSFKDRNTLEVFPYL